MLGTDNVIAHFKAAFPGEFLNARYCTLEEKPSLDDRHGTDLLVVPVSDTMPLAPGQDITRANGVYNAIFLSTMPVDKTAFTIIMMNALGLVANIETTLVNYNINSRNVIKNFFGKDLTSDTFILSIQFQINFMFTCSKTIRPIPYVECK